MAPLRCNPLSPISGSTWYYHWRDLIWSLVSVLLPGVNNPFWDRQNSTFSLSSWDDVIMLFQSKNHITTSQHVKYLREVIFRLFVYVHTCPLLWVCVLKYRQTGRGFHNSSSKLSFTQFEGVLHPSLQKGYTRIRIFFEAIVFHWWIKS